MFAGHVHYSASECNTREDNICASACRIVCLTPILVNIEEARLVCLPLNITLRIQCTSITLFLNFYLAMYYRSILEFRVELECNVSDTVTQNQNHSVHSVSLDLSQVFFTPDVGTWIK